MNRIILYALATIAAINISELSAEPLNEEFWELLNTEQNIVILMRNSHLDRKSGHPLNWDETGKCIDETLLSEQGKQFAMKLGELFQKKGITPNVITSPMCRCTQTASFAFGDDFITHPVLREIASADDARHEAFLAKSAELLINNRSDRPIIFISHRPNIEALTFELISVTEILVGTVNDEGEIEIIGKFEI